MPQDRPASRPVFFNLMQIQMPVGSVASILHRISGVLLALSIPATLYLLQLSLQGASGYDRAADWLSCWPSKALAVLMIWALTHHLLAGVRHLLSDIDVGSHLLAARTSAWIVNACGVLVALLGLGVLF